MLLVVGHLGLLWSGNRMAFFLSHQPRNAHLEALSGFRIIDESGEAHVIEEED
jgi:hypothetical protein